QRGARLSVLKASPEAFLDPALATGLAALAAMSARRGGPDALRSSSDYEPVVFPAWRPLATSTRTAAPVVLVTGAAGQIGRTMIKLLEERGIAHRDLDIVAT